MDLSSASTYLNNLLAKAGLLRGGSTVNFHNPSSEDGSTTRIINLVHDLVTRREKEEEQLESLANTIRTLRNDNAKLQQANEKLNMNCEDLERKNAILEGQQKAFNSTLRNSEAAAKSLRDETSRLKMVLQQVRNQFANDIRKRDVQLGKIKEQLLNPRRNPRNVNTITITGTIPPAAADAGPQNGCGPDCIAQDTADALTELSQTLANENDNLVSITRQTLSTLNTIQGIKDDCHFPAQEESGDTYLSVCPQSFEALSEELQTSLVSLRDLINQPNYVAIEELQERDKVIEVKDKEIVRLQARIEVVEEEWRKAIEMVKMWNDSMRGKLPSAAVAPVEAVKERTVGGLEQILEEDEEEEEDSGAVNPADVSLDEEQLQREASMIVDEDVNEAEEEEARNLENMKNILDMDEEYKSEDEEQFEDNQVEEDKDQMEHDGAGGAEVLGEMEEPDEDQLEDEVPGDEEAHIELEDGQDAEMEDDEQDAEMEDNEVYMNGDLEEEELPDQEYLDETTANLPRLDSTPSPTSPPKSPPHRPRRTPRAIKTRILIENVSPPPLKLRSSPSKQTPKPRRSPRKAFVPAPPSPIHTKINRLLSDVLQAESPVTPKESPKHAASKKTTKRAHFESPIVQDTPELSTPKRGKRDPAPIPQPLFVKSSEENTPTTQRRTSSRVNRRPLQDKPVQGEEEILETPRRSSRAANKRLLFDKPVEGEEETPNTPRRSPRVSKKRVLLDTPEQSTSSRVSKRRKTPAVQRKRVGAMRLNEEDFSH